MIREHLFAQRAPADSLFRWRGADVSRVEGLSDGVFALTLTLLVITTQVPTSFLDFWGIFRDAPVLAVCFTLITLVWHDHYLFFRRYGLQDTGTTALNLVLLFLVILYAYPLKFLFTFLWQALILRVVSPGEFFPAVPEGMPGVEMFRQPVHQAEWMMYLYGAGVVCVFGVLFCMHWRALALRAELGLDDIELAMTRGSMRSHALSAGIGALSIALVAATGSFALGGFAYALNWPAHMWNGTRTDREAKRLKAALDAANAGTAEGAATAPGEG